VWIQRVYGKSLYFQFCSELKTASKIVFKKKKELKCQCMLKHDENICVK
jgi:hypothetical protein